MRTFRLRRRDARSRVQGDDGVVMVYVIFSMLLVTAFVAATLAYAVNSQAGARHDQDYNSALAAAQAGVEDYISHLNRNDNYGRLSPFNDCANLAMKGPKAPSPNSCSWTAATTTGWVDVNAANSVTKPQFHYDVDASALDSSGVINVRSTGRANGVKRSLEVAVGRGGSTQFLYYTDHEDADPGNKVLYPNNNMPASCYSYWHGPSPDAPSGAASPRRTNDNGCVEITFIGGDVLDGAVHTNDTPLYTAANNVLPEFKQGVETTDPACKNVVVSDNATWKNCDRGQSGANYNGLAPKWAKALYLPDNSAAFATYPGCKYTGPTRIIFKADGTMAVWSKQSTSTLTTAACGGAAPMGVNVAVPDNATIYVANASSSHQCVSGEIDGTLPLGTFRNDTRDDSYTYDDGMLPADQTCGVGNAYVQGTLRGHVTLATQNSIVATGDLRLAGGLNGPDLLGLVAANSVEVYHPVLSTWNCTNTNNGRCTQYRQDSANTEVSGWPVRIGNPSTAGIEIDGSIQTLAHSFLVQNYNVGSPRGKLTVRGSIAQEWRGIVGQGSPPSTGYLKDYHYDLRLKYSSPPYFPQFINAVWSARHTGEIPPQY